MPMYAVEEVPGKGTGLIATKDILQGTRIISEKPAITVGSHIASMKQLETRITQQVRALSEDQQREFFTMANIYPYTNPTERNRGVFQTNALPIGPDLDAGGVFLKACRINHACDSNATNFWNDNINELTIHAVRDIRKGEEITISYLSSRRNRRMRQAELQKNFKFTCCCRLCSLPPGESRNCDSKLDRIYVMDCIIESGGIEGLTSSARRMLGFVDEQVRLYNDPAPDVVGLARAYPDAFQIAVANGDLARASAFAERVLSLYLITLGDDSPDVREYRMLVRNPATHKYYGMSMDWKTKLEEVPQGLGPKDFEDWLWKR